MTQNILFAREHKTLYEITLPYVFLGKENYISYEGSMPMSIAWEMENRIPAQIAAYSPVRG